MTYEQLKSLKPSAFKRRCGVHRNTFEQMVEVIRPHLDHRTQFHIATSWGLSESAVCRLIHKVEMLLMKSGKFHQQAQKAT